MNPCVLTVPIVWCSGVTDLTGPGSGTRYWPFFHTKLFRCAVTVGPAASLGRFRRLYRSSQCGINRWIAAQRGDFILHVAETLVQNATGGGHPK